MTVKELKRLIRAYPEDWEIIVASDPEGNEWRHLGSVEGAESITYQQCGFQYVELRLDNKGRPCVTLMPGYAPTRTRGPL